MATPSLKTPPVLVAAAGKFHAGPLLTRRNTWAEFFSHSIMLLIENNSVPRARVTQRATATSELAPAARCFDCLSFQTISRSISNCIPVGVNGAVNTSTSADASQKGVLSDSRGAAQSISEATETDTALSARIISAPHPSASGGSLSAGRAPG